MSLTRWLVVIAVLVVLGLMKVAQQTAITLSAYRVGRINMAVHRSENDTLWLKTKVVALESPIELATTMRERHVELVAWSGLSSWSSPTVATDTRSISTQLAKSGQATGSDTAPHDRQDD